MPEQMAHFVVDAKSDPFPNGDDPRPEDEAELDDTLSVELLPLLAELANPDSSATLWSWPEKNKIILYVTNCI
jgi:hypothetical protein